MIRDFHENRLRRGVYSPPYTDEEGRQLLVAVDRRGRRRFTARVFQNDDETAVAGMLQRLLDQVDPLGGVVPFDSV